jgi:putative endonuclease
VTITVGKFSAKQLGVMGERIVADALAQRGFVILARNKRTRFGEIDLIAKKNKEVLFVEVKTRRTRTFGYPEEAITRIKRLHLSRCAAILAPTFAKNCNYAILVVAVEIDLLNKTARLRRIELDS